MTELHANCPIGSGRSLQSAVRKGYFKIPREVPTVKLAEKNDMSSREAFTEMNRGLDIILGDADLRE